VVRVDARQDRPRSTVSVIVCAPGAEMRDSYILSFGGHGQNRIH